LEQVIRKVACEILKIVDVNYSESEISNVKIYDSFKLKGILSFTLAEAYEEI